MSIVALLLAVATLVPSVVAPADEQAIYRNEHFGCRIELPKGWVSTEQVSNRSGLHVVFVSDSAAASAVQLSLRASPRGEFADADAVRTQALSEVSAERYSNTEAIELKALGREVPGLILDIESAGVSYTLRQAYVVQDDTLFILESRSTASSFDDLRPGFDEIWESFSLEQPSAERSDLLRLQSLAARCGHEIDWATSWEEAARRAEEERKLVLVSVRMYPGFDLSDGLMTGLFMDQDIVNLINSNYVALRLKKGMDAPFARHDAYGLGPKTFGVGALIVNPEGEVLADRHTASDAFLREGLKLFPRGAGAPSGFPTYLPGGSRPSQEETAALCLRRGLVDNVPSILAHRDTAAAHQMLAAHFRRLREGEQAMGQLRAARGAPGAEELLAELDADEAELLLRMGQLERGRDVLKAFLEAYPEHSRTGEVFYRLGTVCWLLESQEVAQSWFRKAVERDPEDRWAWKAAAALTSTAWAMGKPSRLDWPEAELYDSLELAPREALANRGAGLARDDAISHLLSTQRADGSWISPSEMSATKTGQPDELKLAITALCTQALLPHCRRPTVRRAVERGLDWTLAAYARTLDEDPEVYFMDYAVWSRSYLVWLLADVVNAGLEVSDRSALAVVVASAFRDLSDRQQSGGGWSYYVTGDVENKDDPANVSISFTTAAAVRAMLAVRAAGFAVPKGLIAPALDCLEQMRNADGSFVYMLFHGEGGPPRQASENGSAGRGPVCELALHQAGRGSLEHVREALDRYLSGRAGFSRELGKALMHTGPEGQGSHYLMFDYASVAAAIAALPENERAAYREPLLEDVLRGRCADGSFLDNPILGRASATGLALMALDAVLPPRPGD